MEFTPFPKLPRLTKDMVITEKLDGTNASVLIEDARIGGVYSTEFAEQTATAFVSGHYIFAASRKRWITPQSDNFGFANWVKDNAEQLFGLGAGHHFGEWWGRGIQRGYGLDEKRFSLFNVHKWEHDRPVCCHVVPVLKRGTFNTDVIEQTLAELKQSGSVAAPGYDNPEGVIVYHTGANAMFKKTFDNDEGKWKGQ